MSLVRSVEPRHVTTHFITTPLSATFQRWNAPHALIPHAFHRLLSLWHQRQWTVRGAPVIWRSTSLQKVIQLGVGERLEDVGVEGKPAVVGHPSLEVRVAAVRGLVGKLPVIGIAQQRLQRVADHWQWSRTESHTLTRDAIRLGTARRCRITFRISLPVDVAWIARILDAAVRVSVNGCKVLETASCLSVRQEVDLETLTSS